MVEPLFWLGFSILLVAVALTAVLVALVPAVQELARAARSAEKLFDTLNRELPPTLESIRLTGLEITGLTDEVSQGVQSANRVAQQVDASISGVKQQAKRAQKASRGMVVGFQAAWRSLTQTPNKSRRPLDQLPAGSSDLAEWPDQYDSTTYDSDPYNSNQYETVSNHSHNSHAQETLESWEYSLDVEELYVEEIEVNQDYAPETDKAEEKRSLHPQEGDVKARGREDR